MNLRTRWRLFWVEPTWWIRRTINKLLCKISTHPTPYNKKMWCELCPRCGEVMTKEKSQLKFTVRGPDGS